jgi:hypothetical protein
MKSETDEKSKKKEERLKGMKDRKQEEMGR